VTRARGGSHGSTPCRLPHRRVSGAPCARWLSTPRRRTARRS
jgi:hypothetical protein